MGVWAAARALGMAAFELGPKKGQASSAPLHRPSSSESPPKSADSAARRTSCRPRGSVSAFRSGGTGNDKDLLRITVDMRSKPKTTTRCNAVLETADLNATPPGIAIEEEPGLEVGKAPLSKLRGAVQVAVLANRFTRSSFMAAGLGSLKHFIDPEQLCDPDDLIEELGSHGVASESEDASTLSSQAALEPVPPPHPRGMQRRVIRVGDKVSAIRSNCPRQKQLMEMLPSLLGSAPAASSTCSTAASCSPVGSQSRRAPPPAEPPAEPRKSRKSRKATNFTLAFVRGLTVRPRPEQHPLLTAMEQGDGDNSHRDFSRDPEQVLLAQRLDELRWGEQRRGPWAAPPEKRGRLAAEDAVAGVAHKLEAQGGTLLAGAAGSTDVQHSTGYLERIIQIIDPDNCGVVAPDTIVPIMFWMGLSRRRHSALATLELAFGPGDIRVEAIKGLAQFTEVQLRLVEGLRRLARRESLEQLCEYMTDSDWLQIRMWFYAMKRDSDGYVDIVEVQNLFARMEVTSDWQVLFRFLSFAARSDAPQTGPDPPGGSVPSARGRTAQRKFSVETFASLICRCTITWCMHRTLVLLDAPEGSVAGGPHASPSVPASGHDIVFRWTQLQRKIMVSLLVNQRFWGRESRNVLAASKPLGTKNIADDLSPEQWLSLFQRVRAQGMAATLPVGNEADDAGFLRKKAEHHSWSSARS